MTIINRFPSRTRKTSLDYESATISTSSSFFKKRFQFKKRKEAPPRKTVTFCTNTEVFIIEPYAKESIPELWYSKEEERTIVMSNLFTIKEFRENTFTESSLETFLGLERYLKRAEAKKKRDCVCSAVLQAQFYTQSHGNENAAEHIASAYKEAIDICLQYFC